MNWKFDDRPHFIYKSALISTWIKTDFQTHFSLILDLLSDYSDCEHVELKRFVDIHFLVLVRSKTSRCWSVDLWFQVEIRTDLYGACQNRKVLGVLWHWVNFVTRQLCNVYVTLPYVVIFGSNPKIMLSPNLNRNVPFCIFKSSFFKKYYQYKYENSIFGFL